MSQSDRFAISEGLAVLVAAFVALGVVAMFFALRPEAAEDSGAAAAMATLEEERDRLQGDLERVGRELAAAVSAARGEEAEACRKELEEAEGRRLEEQARLELKMEELARDRDRWIGERDALRIELNAALAEKRALTEQVRVLSDAAPEAPAAVEGDVPSPVRMTADIALRVMHDVRVTEVNRQLAYVVLDVGADQGVKAGMVFSVMDGDRVIANATVADVRPELSGAVVDQVVVRFPNPDDRAILRRESN